MIKLQTEIKCREKVLIPSTKPFITFLGNPKNQPIITWDDTAATRGKDGNPVGTMGSSSVAVEADYFMAYGIVFKVNYINHQSPCRHGRKLCNHGLRQNIHFLKKGASSSSYKSKRLSCFRQMLIDRTDE